MPLWFGTDYHHRHERDAIEIEREKDHSHLNPPSSSSSSPSSLFSFFPFSSLSCCQSYYEEVFQTESDHPDDYYHNPEYHEGVLFQYLRLTTTARELVQNDNFNYFILSVIIIAGINIGVQSYNQLSENYALSVLDTCILVVFSIECLIKILSEGLKPYLYFIGTDWKWNIFDFTIVFLSLPFWGSLFGGGSLALLRLVRLMRLGKLIKKIPQLQMIVQGLTGGLSSIGYIMLLLFLVFYLFAIAGYYFFSQNDPFHFGSLPKALITCFVCATLDSWSSVMYVNTYGCDRYPQVYEMYSNSTHSNLLKCENPKPQFVVSTIYFILLVVITALVMLSLFIGAVTLSMQDSLNELKEIATEKKRQEKIKKQLNKMFQARAEVNKKNGASRHLTGRVMSRMSSLKGLNNILKSQSSSEAVIGGEDSSKYHNEKAENNSNLSASHKIREKYLAAPEIESFNEDDLKDPIETLERSTSKNSLPRTVSTRLNEKLAFEKSQSPILLDMQSEKCSKPVVDKSVSPADSYSGSSEMKSVKRSTSRLTIKPSAQDLLQQTQLSFSYDSSETLEMRRKLRIGVGDLAHGVEDEPKSIELFLSRLESSPNFTAKLNLVAEHCKYLAEHPYFVEFVTYIILLAGVNVGANTDPRIMGAPYVREILSVIDKLILAVFTLECILKLFGEFPQPWVYFKDSWNKFDFIIVVGSYTPGVGSLLTILRLLRLLRVLKLVKSLPQLVVIVDALMMGMESIAYIALILFLCFYLFAILGMILFQRNDPFNFGTLHIAMFTLFRCSTLDGWSDLLYTNLYGCDVYPGGTYSSFPELCTDPSPAGFFAVAYFLIFIVIGAQILLTLFIGVVTTSMEEAQDKQDRESKIERQLLSLKTSLDLSPVQVRMFREVFSTLDLDGGGLIEEDEVQIGLKAIGDLVVGTNVEEEIKKADPNGRGIDLVTFIVVFCNIPSCRHRRVLRKTVRRWMSNKRKRGLFFREPRKQLLRKHTRSLWAANAWSFLGSDKKQVDKNKLSQIEATGENITRKSMFSDQLANWISPKPESNQIEQEPEKIPQAPLAKKPSFVTPIIIKRRGSLFRRASTTTLYQTAHEVETAANIGQQIQSKVENIPESSHALDQNPDHRIDSDPTYVRDFEERIKTEL